MVDVGAKTPTRREAEAETFVTLSKGAFEMLVSGRIAKGDAFAVARIAGIQAGKRTSDWIPLAHPLAVERIGVELEPERGKCRVRIVASAAITGKTGIEMEAMVAASAAALALYDMCKAVDRGIVIGPLRLLRKSGGRSGEWRAEPSQRPRRRPRSRPRG
jgi:cyclic pyranopterin phosphate synthase